MLIPSAIGVAIIALAALIFFLGFKHGGHVAMSTIFERLAALEGKVTTLENAPAPAAGASEADLSALAERVTTIEGEIGAAPVVEEQQSGGETKAQGDILQQ